VAVTLPQSFEQVRLSEVELHPENPRQGDVGAIHESIVTNGFYGALVVQRSSRRILAGNHRARAAREAGITELPALVVDVDDETARRILLVDNRSNDLASYDEAALSALLLSMDELAGTGYTMDDLEDLQRRLKVPLFAEAGEDEQGKLDERQPVECPACGHSFVPGRK
jgi:ParB-like chromosome segregation protein Spo0J